jgi:hypothetical protein
MYLPFTSFQLEYLETKEKAFMRETKYTTMGLNHDI